MPPPSPVRQGSGTKNPSQVSGPIVIVRERGKLRWGCFCLDGNWGCTGKSGEKSLRLSASTLCVAVLFLTRSRVLSACPAAHFTALYTWLRARMDIVDWSRNDPGPVTSTRCKMPRHARQASRDEIVQASLLSFTWGQRSRYNLYAWRERAWKSRLYKTTYAAVIVHCLHTYLQNVAINRIDLANFALHRICARIVQYMIVILDW